MATAAEAKKAVLDCFQLGWTMAVLYGEAIEAPQSRDHLRSEHELEPADRVHLEMNRLHALVESLEGSGPRFNQNSFDLSKAYNAWFGENNSTQNPPGNSATALEALKAKLPNSNRLILTTLAKAGREYELSYQLGRSLRDTVAPPARGRDTQDPAGEMKTISTVDRYRYSLGRARVEVLQEWFTTSAQYFPEHAARVVSSSLGRWSDLIEVTLVDDGPGRLRRGGASEAQFADSLKTRLLRQGDVWLALLLGDNTTGALLSPEAYVAAADAAIHRMVRLVGKVLRSYWWALLLLLAVVLGVIFASAALLGNTAQLFTSLGAIATALGVTWKGIGSAIPKLAADAGRPIYGIEEVEAMAVAVTNLPPVSVTGPGVRYLRTAGAAAQAPLAAF